MITFISWKYLTRNLSQRYNSAWKNYNVFPSIGRYITSHIAKFEAKIPLVSEEIKKEIWVGGRLD